MPNPLSLRIRRWPFKLLYVVVAYIVVFVLAHLFALLDGAGSIAELVNLVLDVGAFLYGARIFRGSNEDVVAPRALWRMTARRPMSKRLGVFFAVVAGLVLMYLVAGIFRLAGADLGHFNYLGPGVVTSALTTAAYGILAFLYLRSARHLPLTDKIRYMGEPPFQVDRLYSYFNARRADEAVRYLHPEVEWPNGWEGGYVHGRKAVRDYWERQWKEIDPKVTPLGIHIEEDRRLTVRVHQVVHDRDGKLLSDSELEHVYRSRDGLFDRMEILHADA
jgi:SnoaL-like domain